MNRRKFISFLAGFLTAIPFCGLLFNKSEPEIDLSTIDEQQFDLATHRRIAERLSKLKFKPHEVVYIGGKRYRVISNYDDGILKGIEGWQRLYEIGGRGIVK